MRVIYILFFLLILQLFKINQSDYFNRFLKEVFIKDDFIKLGQALKLCGAVQSGVEAKQRIIDGEIKVNGVTEIQRGKKLREEDKFSCDGNDYVIKKKT